MEITVRLSGQTVLAGSYDAGFQEAPASLDAAWARCRPVRRGRGETWPVTCSLDDARWLVRELESLGSLAGDGMDPECNPMYREATRNAARIRKAIVRAEGR